MNWAWAASLDHLWRSPNFSMWVTLAVAGFFGIIVLIMLLRAERSVANGALAVITLLSIGVAGAATVHGFGTTDQTASTQPRAAHLTSAALPQLSCIDDLAGDAVLVACEKALFGSPESVAAAVAYMASQITRLTSAGGAADKSSDLLALRRAIERDRYGLAAYVLMARDQCTPQACAAFRSLADTRQVVSNMDERSYESLIMRYSPSWNAPPQAAAGLVAALPASVPTGKPTNVEFPSSASTPPVSIMNPEPPLGAAAPKPPAASAPRPAAAPAASPAPSPSPALTAAKKPPTPPKRPAAAPAAAPVQLSPSAAPAAANSE